MDIDTDLYDDEPTQPRKAIQPHATEPQIEMEATQEILPAQPLPTTPFARGVPTVPLRSNTTPFSPLLPFRVASLWAYRLQVWLQ